MKLQIILAGLCLGVMCVYFDSVDANPAPKDKGIRTGSKEPSDTVGEGQNIVEDEKPTLCDDKGGPKNQNIGEKCKPGLCEACEDDNAVCIFECNKYDDGDGDAEAQYACNCKPGYEESCGVCVQNDGNHGDSCSVDNDHCTGRLGCIDGKCTCPSGFYYLENDKECYGRSIDEPCSSSYDTCDKGSNLKCVGGFCICDDLSGYKYDIKYRMCLGGNLGNECRTTCNDLHASCTNNRCSCTSGYVAVNGVCVGSTYTDVCNPAVDTCSNAQNLACSLNGKCECYPSTFTWSVIQSKCVGTELGEVCDNCSDPHASCVGVCGCDSPYQNSNGVCEIVKPPDAHHGQTCEANPDNCVDDYTVCTGGECVCNDYSVYDKILKKCVIYLGAPCSSQANTCADSHATCQSSGCGETCTCTNGYVNSSPGTCGGNCVANVSAPTYGESCDGSIPCTPADSVECSNGTCECKEDFEHAGAGADYCVKTVYEIEHGGSCSCGDVCKPPEKAFCNTGKANPTCECKPGYVLENNICKSGLNGSCHDSPDCAYYPMLRCYNLENTFKKQRICRCQLEGVNGVILSTDGTTCACKNPGLSSCYKYQYENSINSAN